MSGLLRKDQLEKSLHDEQKLIQSGQLKEDNPLDTSPAFLSLCEAARRDDLKGCQEAIQQGANINASDPYNYTPLILASLCGHYEVVKLLLESGALCERDTFQGERCLYNALNDRIRNLLLSYDYSKSSDPLQPFASHLFSLLGRTDPSTSDITVVASGRSFALHKFILAARSPYFGRKLAEKPETSSWSLPENFPAPAFEVAVKYLYMGEIPREVSGSLGTGHTEEDILEGIDRLSRLFEVPHLMQYILESDNRRAQRQQRQAEVERGREQVDLWFRENALKHKVEVEKSKSQELKWTRNNAIFADVLLCADNEPVDESEALYPGPRNLDQTVSTIPVGPLVLDKEDGSQNTEVKVEVPKVTLFPVHRAMLLRSEYFLSMFSSSFVEAQESNFLRIVPVACSAQVLELILLFLYGERTEFGLQLAIDVLFAADMLLVDRLKTKAAVIVSTLGNGAMNAQHPAATPHTDPFLPAAKALENAEDGFSEEDPLDPYATLRAAWDLRVPRLETFSARYFAYRLEKYIDEPDFSEIIRESAARIKGRQETDSIELVDDIRYYLSERFRLRFEGDGLDELLNEDSAPTQGNEPGQAGVDASLKDLNTAVEGVDKIRLDETGAPDDSRKEGPTALLNGSSTTEVAGVQVIRTLDGEEVGDEFAADALNYQMLMGKIDALLDNLQLDA